MSHMTYCRETRDKKHAVRERVNLFNLHISPHLLIPTDTSAVFSWQLFPVANCFWPSTVSCQSGLSWGSAVFCWYYVIYWTDVTCCSAVSSLQVCSLLVSWCLLIICWLWFNCFLKVSCFLLASCPLMVCCFLLTSFRCWSAFGQLLPVDLFLWADRLFSAVQLHPVDVLGRLPGKDLYSWTLINSLPDLLYPNISWCSYLRSSGQFF